jgi:hypothetical protein
VPHHLEPVPRPERPVAPETGHPDPTADEHAPLVRPPWWRWVAIAVIVAMVVAGPVAFVLSKLLD